MGLLTTSVEVYNLPHPQRLSTFSQIQFLPSFVRLGILRAAAWVGRGDGICNEATGLTPTIGTTWHIAVQVSLLSGRGKCTYLAGENVPQPKYNLTPKSQILTPEVLLVVAPRDNIMLRQF